MNVPWLHAYNNYILWLFKIYVVNHEKLGLFLLMDAPWLHAYNNYILTKKRLLKERKLINLINHEKLDFSI
jgi:hypothetical protein